MGADITREDGCFRVITAEDPRAWPKSPVNIPWPTAHRPRGVNSTGCPRGLETAQLGFTP